MKCKSEQSMEVQISEGYSKRALLLEQSCDARGAHK